MHRNRILWALLAVGFLGGCSSPTHGESEPDLNAVDEPVGGVALTVSLESYRHGDTVDLQLVNGSGASIGYNACTASRELKTGSTWVRSESLRLCDMALYTLKAGETVAFGESVGADWQPGTYRIVLRIERFSKDDSFYLGSKEFTVTP